MPDKKETQRKIRERIQKGREFREQKQEEIHRRIIHSLAQEVRYTCILKLNNLVVRI